MSEPLRQVHEADPLGLSLFAGQLVQLVAVLVVSPLYWPAGQFSQEGAALEDVQGQILYRPLDMPDAEQVAYGVSS